MPTLMPSDTRGALGQNAERCDSRSLFFDRFANPEAKEDDRKDWFQKVIKLQPIKTRLPSWQAFLRTLPQQNNLLYAQLQARLMVNMAGGAMENAGLCLDRFGMPYIPGSAVKGCARRAALAALHEWADTGQKPGNDHPLASACASFASPAQMLAAIALVFGWCEQDWSEMPNISDFTWACPSPENRQNAAAMLAEAFGWPIQPNHQATLWKDLPNFAGLISFLPAYPVDLGKTVEEAGLPCRVPELGKLELDVVTCHHRDYYSSNDPNAVATDTEDPNPVVFSAVAPGHVFAFALLPMPRGAMRQVQIQWGGTSFNLLELAKTWLAAGLAVFGLGAKTNAGYGWFDVSDKLQEKVCQCLKEIERKRQEEERRRQEEEKRKVEEEQKKRKAEELRKATANMGPEEKLDYEISKLNDDQFRGRLESFKDRKLEEQQAIVRALRLSPDAPNSRRKFWDELKTKAKNGGKPAQIEQAIRELSRKMYPGKEGKMP